MIEFLVVGLRTGQNVVIITSNLELVTVVRILKLSVMFVQWVEKFEVVLVKCKMRTIGNFLGFNFDMS